MTFIRFLLRVLPIEVSCYASDEEITRAIKPLIEQHFPVETQTPHKVILVFSKSLFMHYTITGKM